MLTPKLSLSTSSDCSSFSFTDATEYSVPYFQENVICRSIKVTDSCGNLVETTAQKKKYCLSIDVQPVFNNVYTITVEGKTFQYTALTEDIVSPGPDVSASEALVLSANNIFKKLYAIIGTSLDCYNISVAYTDCDTSCNLSFEATFPGYDFWVEVTGSGLEAVISTTNLCNFSLIYNYDWDFSTVSTPIIVNSLTVNEVDFITSPLIASGATLQDQLDDIVLQLNSTISIGTFLRDGNSIVLSTTYFVEGFGGTGNAIPFAISPSKELASTQNQELVLGGYKDGIYATEYAITTQTPVMYKASLQVASAPAPTTATYVVISITNIFTQALRIYFPTSATINSYHTYIATSFNRFVEEVLELTSNDLYAENDGTKVVFYVSAQYLANIGQTSATVALSPTITNGAFNGGGSQNAFNVITPVDSTLSTAVTKESFLVLCNAYKTFAEIVKAEFASCSTPSSTMPVSMEVNGRIAAIQQAMCQGDYVTAEKIIKLLNKTTYKNGCKNCGC